MDKSIGRRITGSGFTGPVDNEFSFFAAVYV